MEPSERTGSTDSFFWIWMIPHRSMQMKPTVRVVLWLFLSCLLFRLPVCVEGQGSTPIAATGACALGNSTCVGSLQCRDCNISTQTAPYDWINSQNCGFLTQRQQPKCLCPPLQPGVKFLTDNKNRYFTWSPYSSFLINHSQCALINRVNGQQGMGACTANSANCTSESLCISTGINSLVGDCKCPHLRLPTANNSVCMPFNWVVSRTGTFSCETQQDCAQESSVCVFTYPTSGKEFAYKACMCPPGSQALRNRTSCVTARTIPNRACVSDSDCAGVSGSSGRCVLPAFAMQYLEDAFPRNDSNVTALCEEAGATATTATATKTAADNTGTTSTNTGGSAVTGIVAGVLAGLGILVLGYTQLGRRRATSPGLNSATPAPLVAVADEKAGSVEESSVAESTSEAESEVA